MNLELLKQLLAGTGLSSSSPNTAPLIYPQETREMMSSAMPILGGGATAAATAANPVLGGAMMALQAGTSLLGNKQPKVQAPAETTSGRSFPWQNTALYQQANQIPQTNFISMLSRILRG